jgi:hypothetical protein
MSDDRFDRDLQARLRTYESRLPAADAPVPGAEPAGSPRWPLIGLGVASVAAVLAVAMLLGQPRDNIGDATPSPSPSTSPTTAPPIASGSLTAAEASGTPPPTELPTSIPATPVPTPASADLAWSRTASFPSSGGLSMVTGIARIGDRYVAVGVEYVQELPVFGPTPPHDARAWTSPDGRSWALVDLGPGFENATFGRLIQRGDASLISLGARGIVSEFGINESEPAAWTTTDGLTWTEVDPPLDGFVAAVEQGARGVLAVVRPSISTDRWEFWLAADGEAWERVHSLEANYVDIDAGDEGFAAVGWVGEEDGYPLSIASADGRQWIEAPTPPFGRFLEVAAHAGDWIVVDDPGGVAPTWFSANGLDWAAHGEIPFKTVGIDDAECREYRSQLTSDGPWLVTTSELTYPCSESGFVVHGTQYLSVDGATWQAMPLAQGTPGENRSGSSVNDALATDAGLILVGEENGAAAFWFGDAP